MTAGQARIALSAFSPAARDALRALQGVVGPEGRAWVVGGALRDALIGRLPGDIDIAVPAGAVGIGRALADRLRAAFVVLDERRGVCRVVGAAQVDLADFRGPDLADDLRGRDFTVNALAARVHDLVDRGDAAPEDVTGGLGDLAARRVRLCSPRSLGDDPARVLRAARLAIEPGWSLGSEVEPAARGAATALAGISAERVRDELIALLSAPAAGAGLRLLDRFGALSVVLPESLPMRDTLQPLPHRFDVWEHSLRAVEATDAIQGGIDRLEPWAPELREHLAEGLGDGLHRGAALKLAALLHDVAKPETRALVDGRIRFIGHDRLGAARARAIAGRWRLSGRARDVIARLVDQHLRPMHLSQAGQITRRARYRFFRDLGDDARDLLLLSLADASAVRGDSAFVVWAGGAGEVLRALMAGMAEETRTGARRPLISGDDVMQALGIGPGRAVGRLLDEVREARAEGLISTREEALDHVRRTAARLLDTPDGPP